MADKELNPATMWDERYGRAEAVYGHEPNAYLKDQAARRLKAGAAVLVPADGYGRNGLWLAKQGFAVTTGGCVTGRCRQGSEGGKGFGCSARNTTR